MILRRLAIAGLAALILGATATAITAPADARGFRGGGDERGL
jgi:hypothetical protein